MKVKVIRKGISDPKGGKVPIGEVFDLGPKATEVPAFLVNKVSVIEQVVEDDSDDKKPADGKK